MSTFNYELGLLVTGKENVKNIYSITNSKALMVVTNIFNNGKIGVVVVDTINSLHLGLYFEVYAKDFIPVSLKEWMKINTYCKYKSTEEIIARVHNSAFKNITKIVELDGFVSVSTQPEIPIPAEISSEYVLSDEDRKMLSKEIITLLDEYDYHPTEIAVNKIIDEWVKNKGYLINLISKHPNYNGKFQIAFSKDYDRVIDKHAILNFGNWLYNKDVEKFTLPIPISKGCFNYNELVDIIERINITLGSFDEVIYSINNKTYDDYEKEYNHFVKLKNDMLKNIKYRKWNGSPVTEESYAKYRCFKEIREYICNYKVSQFVTQSFVDIVNRYAPEFKIVVGQKMSKAINKIFTQLGLSKHPEYNKMFAKFSDGINPLKIKRHTVLSVHPVDYFTMSFGNSWASCHTIDKTNKRCMPNSYSGCYSSGTLSYMLDGTSMVFYTVDAKAKEDNLELEPKINRNMFHYDKAKLVQGRIYPQDCDSGCNDMYEDFRNVVQKIIADCLGVDNLWNLSKGTSACLDVITSKGTHYRDYANYSNCNVSTLKLFKKLANSRVMEIGHRPICPSCGREHTCCENIECSSSYCSINS